MSVTANSINIDGIVPKVSFAGNVRGLQLDDKYYLLRGNTVLAGNIGANSEKQIIQHGSLLEATVQFKKEGDNDFITEIISSNSGNPDPSDPDPGDPGGGTAKKPVIGSKSITRSAMMVALANQGGDLAAGKGMQSAITSAKEDAWGTFAVVDVSSIRYNTGSHVDASSVNLMTDISRINTEIGKLTAGVFFEYAGASYNTKGTLTSSTSVNGSGNVSYICCCLLCHLKFNDVGPGHFYTEAIARINGLNNDYKSNRLKDTFERKASFDTESTYYGMHAGVGYMWNITDEISLDIYGKYFLSHQDGINKRISTGELVNFDTIDSYRVRGGARFTYAINEYVSPYIGAAFEYEFDGKARASVWGYDLEAAKPEGETGIGEAGLIFKPCNKSPWLVDLGVQGYVGKREGVSGSLRVGVEF